MLSRLSQPVKICLGSILAAFLIGLQNIDEYAQQLESKYPEQMELPEMLRSISRYTGLPQWFELQKDLYTSLGASEGEEEEFPNNEPDFQITEEAEEEPEPAPAPEQVIEPPVEEKKEAPSGKKEKPGKQPVVISAAEPPAPPVEVKPAEVEVPRPRVRNRLGLVWKKSVRKLTRRRIRSSYPRRLKYRGNRRRWKQLKRRNVPQEPWPRPEPPHQPEPAPAPQPEPTSVPQPEPTPEPQPEPVPAPQPEPAPAPQPEPAPAPQPEPTPVPAQQLSAKEILESNKKQPVHYRIMMMGDSMMQSLAPQAYKSYYINRQGLHFIFSARFSTGLSNPDYFNWPESMRNTVEQKRPHLIVIFIGANDGVPIVEERKVLYPAQNAPWKAAYARKMQQVLDIAQEFGCKLVWIGLPPMGPRYQAMKRVIASQREVCREKAVTFLDTNPFLADSNGQIMVYTTNSRGKTVRLRMKDQCHMTGAGNDLILKYLNPIIEQHIYDFRQNNPQRCLSPKEMEQIQKARWEVSINPMRPKNKKK